MDNATPIEDVAKSARAAIAQYMAKQLDANATFNLLSREVPAKFCTTRNETYPYDVCYYWASFM